MLHKYIDINVDYEKLGLEKSGSFQPRLECFVPHNARVPAAKRPTIVICPGGGYAFTSDREGEPIALSFMNEGFNCFVVWYSVAEPDSDNVARFPVSLYETLTAIAMIRENAEEWLVDTDKIFVCGFSAGGHLAASVATLWNRDFVKDALGYHNGEQKPNGAVLVYPVISSGKWAHSGSFEFLLGDRANDPEMLELLSLEKQVTSDTPPCFLIHTFTDEAVPVKNSIDFASALAENKIPFEMHIFPRGPHGFARADDSTSYNGEHIVPECTVWPSMAARWARSL